MNVLLILLLLVCTYVGVATTYDEPRFVGQPLYCDSSDNDLYYDAATMPWIAVDVSEYLTGRVQCGDVFLLRFADGTMLEARAQDAGYLYDAACLRRHYLDDNQCLPIVADVPTYLAPFTDTSSVVTMVNISAYERSVHELYVSKHHDTASGYFIRRR